MKHILCFGDSNTYGTNPRGGRWPLEVRWTGIVQQLLGDSYRIIEEGCGGRTTRYGKTILKHTNVAEQPCLWHWQVICRWIWLLLRLAQTT